MWGDMVGNITQPHYQGWGALLLWPVGSPPSAVALAGVWESSALPPLPLGAGCLRHLLLADEVSWPIHFLPVRPHTQETLIGRAQGTHLCPSSKQNEKMSSFKEAGLIPQDTLQTQGKSTQHWADRHEKWPLYFSSL